MEKNKLCSDTTSNVTQIHASGFEYSSNPDDLSSAYACIEGGIGFMNLFGADGLKTLQAYGILDNQRTIFELTHDTHEKTDLKLEKLQKSVELLRQHYQECVAGTTLEKTLPA